MATWLLNVACSYPFIDLGDPAGIKIHAVDKVQARRDSSQAGSGTIRGIVIDKNTGERIPGVSVRLGDTQMGSAANFDGSFFIGNIPPGKYALTIKTIGYYPIIKEDLKVRADETIEMEVWMQRQAITRSFGDWFRPPLIDRYQTSNQKTIDEDEIEAMPASTADEILKKTQGFVR